MRRLALNVTISQFRFLHPAPPLLRLVTQHGFHTEANDIRVADFLFQPGVLGIQDFPLGGERRGFRFPRFPGNAGATVHMLFQIIPRGFVQDDFGPVRLVEHISLAKPLILVQGSKGKATITITAPNKPGMYDVVALLDGNLRAGGTIEVVAYNPNIWETLSLCDS